jgi:hypothetical protein
MRLAAVAVSVLVLLGAAGTEAWAGTRKLPKPLDSPIVRAKVQEHHKPGKRNGRHSAANDHPNWGREKAVYTSKQQPTPIKDYLYQE